MANQRTDEWNELDEQRLRYHTAQWEAPKRSTIAFESFCRPWLEGSKRVVDVACGTAGSTAYIAARHSRVEFLGIDLSPELVAVGERIVLSKAIANLRLQVGDCFALDAIPGVDGVISLQTLSWLPEFEAPLAEVFDKLAPRWIAASSLFYEGDISCRTEVEEHAKGTKYFYNTYSLPALARFARAHGYTVTTYAPFAIDIDLPRPVDPNVMGTYTRTVRDADDTAPTRLQISGPLLMSWYQVLIERQ